MLKNRLMRALPLTALGAALVLAPMSAVRAANVADGTVTLTSPMQAATEPVTAYGLMANQEVPTFDPTKASDSVSINPIENLFLGLTDISNTAELRNEVATDVQRSEDGLKWTFTIRTDIPWVRYDAAEKKVIDTGLKVTAKDFEYGIKRACDPRTAATYGQIAATIVKGCDTVNSTAVDKMTDDALDQVGVKALSDTQIEIETQGIRPYFDNIAAMWMMRAVPRATIEEFGEQWTQVGKIVTNGPYVIESYEPGVALSFVKNPFYPNIHDAPGNIERISQVWIEDANTGFTLYLNSQIDSVGVPRAEIARIKGDAELNAQLIQGTDLSVWYYAFAHDKPPFDKVEVRRAFSAAIDRKAFVEQVRPDRSVPMAHFMPPGIRGAVPINEVGLGNPDNLGFDLEYAKAQLAAAGYPNCEGLPAITFAAQSGAEIFAEYLQNVITTNLGCEANKISIESLEFSVYLQAIRKDKPTAERPNIWLAGWGPDYPDAHNWVHDVLSCNATNDFLRPCTDLDKKIDAAAVELDGEKRDAEYRAIEEAFFGKDGEFPIAPLYLRLTLSLVKPWYAGNFDTDGLFGGVHWESRTIDQAAQTAGREKGASQPIVVPTATPAP